MAPNIILLVEKEKQKMGFETGPVQLQALSDSVVFWAKPSNPMKATTFETQRLQRSQSVKRCGSMNRATPIN